MANTRTVAQATTTRRPKSARARRPSASEVAYALLREDIVACVCAPGQRLTESDVAEQLRIGKTPVREALRRLVHDRLVQVHPRKGYVVAPVTLQDVEDLCGLRLIVEPAAVSMAAGKLDPMKDEKLEKLSHIGYDVKRPESVRAFHHANRAFHTTIAEACGNPRLTALVDTLLLESQRIIQFGMLLYPHSDEAVHSHQALLRAVRKQQPASARRLVEREIRATERMVIEGLLRSASLRTFAVAVS